MLEYILSFGLGVIAGELLIGFGIVIPRAKLLKQLQKDFKLETKKGYYTFQPKEVKK